MRYRERGETTNTERLTGSLLALAFGLGLALFIYTFIDKTSLWQDELLTVHKACNISLRDLYRHLRSDTHPPAYYIVLRGYIFLADCQAHQLRFFSWVWYLISACSLGASLWRIRNKANGTIAFMIALAYPAAIRYSLEGKGYSMMIGLISCSLLLRSYLIPSLLNKRDRVDRPPVIASRALSAAYVAVMSLTALTHYSGLIYLFGLILADYAFSKRMSLLGCIAGLPALLWVLINLDNLTSRSSSPTVSASSFITDGTSLYFANNYILVAIVLCIAWLILSRDTHNSRTKNILHIANTLGGQGVFIAILIVAFLSFRKGSFTPVRYYLFAVPFFVCSMAIIVESVFARICIRSRPAHFKVIYFLFIAVATIGSINEGTKMLKVTSEGSHRHGEGNYALISVKHANTPSKYAVRCHLFNAMDRALFGSSYYITSKWQCIGGSSEIAGRLAEEQAFTMVSVQDSGSQHIKEIDAVQEVARIVSKTHTCSPDYDHINALYELTCRMNSPSSHSLR